ncbi:MAG: cyclopropane fatty acyl phospholipid synthase [Acidobacteriota bacterium]
MRRTERIVKELLAKAGVAVNGDMPWDIQVRDRRFFGRVIRERSLGLGEAYMEGWWDCESLDQFFTRICAAGLDSTEARRPLPRLLDAAMELLVNRQSPRRADQVARAHYDLGNEMFHSWLDRHKLYSCGYFADTDDLDQAQERKLDLICRKAGLSAGDEVLDVGCGWGGFCAYAAGRYGCRVTGVNVSGEQVAHAREACADLGGGVEIIRRDYRDISGTFDKIVSVGMFEHVGHKNHRAFMRSMAGCLRAGGTFLLHTIGANVSSFGCDAWIRKYIFPNGDVPSLAQIAHAAEGLFVVEDVHNLGPHYDKTLMAWHERFRQAWPRLKEGYPESFRRMWEYYLLQSAGAFRARALQLWQIVMTPQGSPQPACRLS